MLNTKYVAARHASGSWLIYESDPWSSTLIFRCVAYASFFCECCECESGVCPIIKVYEIKSQCCLALSHNTCTVIPLSTPLVMQLQLVFRFLRKISDWTVHGFYSEVHLEGRENVAEGGPLIMYVHCHLDVNVLSWRVSVQRPTQCISFLLTLSRLVYQMWTNAILNSASTHHNEIIDIATLGENLYHYCLRTDLGQLIINLRTAVTIPYRRHLSFWAKSTMFVNPITGAILSSSGAIPVRRNPNNVPPPVPSSTEAPPRDPSFSKNVIKKEDPISEDSSRSSLFKETSKALASNQVVGVFPEGTSYTQSSIVQVMTGAAWAAVEYARYIHDHNETSIPRSQNGNGKGKDIGLKIVPVAIVYTDKSRYQSRVSHSTPNITPSLMLSFLQICVTYGYLSSSKKKWLTLTKFWPEDMENPS